MTYVIAQPCVDVKDRACVDECPVDCIYEGGAHALHSPRGVRGLWRVRACVPHRSDLLPKMTCPRNGQTTCAPTSISSTSWVAPAVPQKTGVQDYDDPMIAALPPQNEEWKAENL